MKIDHLSDIEALGLALRAVSETRRGLGNLDATEYGAVECKAALHEAASQIKLAIALMADPKYLTKVAERD